VQELSFKILGYKVNVYEADKCYLGEPRTYAWEVYSLDGNPYKIIGHSIRDYGTWELNAALQDSLLKIEELLKLDRR